MRSSETFSQAGKVPCNPARRFPRLGKCHATLRDVFPGWENALHSSETISRAGKTPCNSARRFLASRKGPATQRDDF